MTRKDPYEILGVDRSATPDQVKSAYRKLAKQHHPDRNPGNKQSEQRFKEVQAAYEVLGDKDRRAQYDRFGAGGPAPDVHEWTSQSTPGDGGVEFNFGDMGDLGSIFEQFFSRGGARTRAARAGGRRTQQAEWAGGPRGENLEHPVEVSFEEAIQGTNRDLALESGNGDGRSSERINVRIPPGVADGQLIRVKGKGQTGPGGRGDLLLRMRVRPHAYFRRDGLDVLLDLPLSIAEAVLGASVDVPTLNGETTVKIPPGTSSGARLRLRGKGIHDPRSGATGDMYVAPKIIAPKEVTPKGRELVEQLDKELKQDPRKDAPWH